MLAFNILWIIAIFLIPFFQSYFTGKLIQENGRINLKVILKSNFFWCLIVLWVIGNSCILFLNSQESDKEVLNSGSSNNEETRIVKTQDDYLEDLKGLISEEIVFYDYNDYDGNGECEMFALVGEREKDDWHNLSGEVWYVDQTGAKKIEDDKRTYWNNPKTYRIKGQCFLALEEFYVTGSVTFLWSVKNGVPYQPNLSGRGNGISVNEYDEIELVDSEYDAHDDQGIVMVGHTWKSYYFYYDGENFKEYGGREITKQELLKIKGTGKILKRMKKEGYSIDSIYYRENNMCNINFSKKELSSRTFEWVTIRFNEQLKVVGEVYDNGIYKAAFLPDIATYPENLFY